MLVVLVSSSRISRRVRRSGGRCREADAGAGLVASVAQLLAVVAGVAGLAFVYRDVPASDRRWDNGFGGYGCVGVAAGPGGLAAVFGAVALPADAGERGPAEPGRAAGWGLRRGCGRRVVSSWCRRRTGWSVWLGCQPAKWQPASRAPRPVGQRLRLSLSPPQWLAGASTTGQRARPRRVRPRR